ncbi:MAG: hypothetical protein ABFD46_09750 [Armatimonadota bacterium]
MIRIRQMRLVSYIAALLIVTMYISPVASFAKRGPSNVLQKKTILVYPFENAVKSSIETLSDDIAKSLQSAIKSTDGLNAVVFSDRLPSIQRSVRELTLKPDDVKGPFGTDQDQIACALKVSKEIAADLQLIGSIDAVQVDTAANKAEVTLSAVLTDIRTGETVKSIAITGKAPANTSKVDAELVAMAAADAVAQMTKELAPAGQTINSEPTTTKGNEPVVVKTRNKKKKSALRRFIIPLVIGVTIALVSSNSDDNSSSEDIDNPPVVPF